MDETVEINSSYTVPPVFKIPTSLSALQLRQSFLKQEGHDGPGSLTWAKMVS